MTVQKNIFGFELVPCSRSPLAGFQRTGRCEACADDLGVHVVCAEMTPDFLVFSKARGNDLVTPHPEFGFPGLNAGDRWCLCAGRWVEAFNAGVAPPIVLAATHAELLEYVSIEVLKRHAIDLV